VFVVFFEALLVGVRMGVGLSAVLVLVLVLVLHVLVLVPDMCVRMRHISVGVLVSVLRGHCAPVR
jgi:hypothetical protein